MDYKINYKFLQHLEGKPSNFGYIPKDTKGGVESGVTIATGIDLGGQNAESITELGMERMLKQLQPYLGLKGQSAKDYLRSNPLNLKSQDVKDLDLALQNQRVARLEKQFNNSSKVKFAELPSEYQTVLTSVAHQYYDLPKRTPNFWKQMTGGQYDKALGNLRDFGDEYGTRRNKEADLFQRGLIKQFLAGEV